jgi:hypothetical protein
MDVPENHVIVKEMGKGEFVLMNFSVWVCRSAFTYTEKVSNLQDKHPQNCQFSLSFRSHRFKNGKTEKLKLITSGVFSPAVELLGLGTAVCSTATYFLHWVETGMPSVFWLYRQHFAWLENRELALILFTSLFWFVFFDSLDYPIWWGLRLSKMPIKDLFPN